LIARHRLPVAASPGAILVLAAGLSLAAVAAGLADDSPALAPSDGPVEIRDEHVLAQGRLTLPPIAPDTLARGDWSFRVGLLWCNSFAWTQDVPGEHPKDRRFLIDGETRTLDLVVARGIGRNVQVGVRLPLRWRGGGSLDGLIDGWHRAFGLPNGNRPAFLENAFRVEGVTREFTSFSWNDAQGTGLGNLELEGRWRVHDGGPRGWRTAVAARVALPTGTGPFGDDQAGLGVQLVAAKRLAGRLDLFIGGGGLVQGSGPVRGIAYEPWRGHVFLVLDLRLFGGFHVLAETDAATRLIRDIDLYPGMHWITNVSGRVPLSSRARFEFGFTENFKNQMSTTDFGLHFGLALRPARKGPP
jgi:hypothetical protein